MDRGTPIGKGGQKAQRPTEASTAFPLRIHPTVVSATGEEDGNLSGPIIVSRLAWRADGNLTLLVARQPTLHTKAMRAPLP